MSEACDVFFLEDSEKTNCLCVGGCDLDNDQTLSRLVDVGRFQRQFEQVYGRKISVKFVDG